MGNETIASVMDRMETLADAIDEAPDARALFMQFFSAVHEPLFVVNGEKEIVYINDHALKLIGFSEEEVIGKPCLVGIRCVNCVIECALFKDGSVVQRNLEFVSKSGKILKVKKNAQVIRNQAGEIIAGVETFQDVTDYIEKFSALSGRLELIGEIVNNLDFGILAIDNSGTINFTNNRMLTITGSSIEQTIGTRLSDLLGREVCLALQQDELSGTISTAVHGADGNSIHLEMTILDEQISNWDYAGKILLFKKIAPNDRVQQVLKSDHSYHGVISQAPAMVEIFNLIESVSDSEATILIDGESGTGKEVIAKAIHESSKRNNQPFVNVNCAVLNENLLESELFGHCKGAFTGAISDKVGRFELADKGTIFLDEIGELPPSVQVKLLRFLQSREFERVGELKTRRVNVRIIAATNKNLQDLITQGEFRDDLYYRLNVIPISLPPLRERREDIPLLVEHFIKRFEFETGRKGTAVDEDAMLLLNRHNWLGNIRELENAMHHAFACCNDSSITPGDLPKIIRVVSKRAAQVNTGHVQADNIRDLEKETLIKALQDNAFNRSRAAASLGITRTTLWRKMKRFGLSD